MIVGMADCWKDIVEHAEALHQLDNDLLLKAFREFLAALASALYLFLIVEVFSSRCFYSLRESEERIATGKVDKTKSRPRKLNLD